MKMVQKTKPTKLGIQAASVKPSSGQHLEGKNKTTDLKKKMKRSKLVKLSDTESLKSSSYLRPLKKNLDLPGKPPPFTNPSSTTPIKKQSLIKTIDGSGSPNYMKSTSSSKARTGSSQVSSHNLDRRNSTSPRSSGFGSGYSNRPAKTLTRTSNLKLVRILTKAPSFKHKRSSRVALCADANLQRSTCSSTMKDYKFPSYLELNHGGTESEGTSVLKVCPYNYCSLNGHHHSSLPPLKSFLSARRRAMKSQKGLKVEALSPRKNKPFYNVAVEKDDEINEVHISPLVKDGSFDFYIEIYAKSKGDEEGKQESESLSDEPPCSEVDFGDNVIEQESVEMLEKNEVGESIPTSESEDGLSDALDMEWEEEHISGLEDENGAEFLPEADEQSKTNQSELQLEPVVFSDEQYETEEFDRVDEVVLDFTEGIHVKAGEDFKIGAFENSCTIDVDEGASETSSSVLEEDCAWINEQNLVEAQAGIQQVEMEADQNEDSQHGICENNCTIDLKEEALDPSNINCPLLFHELTDGCNEETETSSDSTSEMKTPGDEAADHNDDQEYEKQVPCTVEAPSQEVTGLSDYQHEVTGLSDYQHATKNDSGLQIDENESTGRWTTRRNRSGEDLEGHRDFNPRAPNFLPLVPEQDGEKVDLRPLMMDEKRNAEEWMLDYALRQTVTKLAPAKKKKVALLVEAFEAVMPIPKFESHLRHSSTPFAHGRPIQACS